MNFKQWYRMVTEAGTSTACVAMFARPVFGGNVTRDWPDLINDEDSKKFRRKHHHKKKKKDD